MIKKIIFLFLTWRIFLFLPLILANSFLTNRSGYGYTLLTYFLSSENKLLSHFLLYPFGNFDAAYYLIIAAEGYTVNGGFFPLFPLSIHLATSPFKNIPPFDPIQYFVATSLVIIYFLIALNFFYRLLRLDYKENVAIGSIIFLLIFPTSFFFASIYSEGLFLLLSILSFYFARKRKWFLASLFAGLMSATRLVGIAMFPALLYEYFKSEKNKSLGRLLTIFLTPLGLIVYAFYNFQKWGNPFYFIEAQGNFANNRSVDAIVLFPQTLFRYIKILLTVRPTIYEWWVALLEFSVFIFVSIMIYIAWKKQVRLSYLIFSVAAFLIPISTGTFSGLPRYILPIFPIFIALSLVKNALFKIVYIVTSIILLALLFALFSKGYFVA